MSWKRAGLLSDSEFESAMLQLGLRDYEIRVCLQKNMVALHTFQVTKRIVMTYVLVKGHFRRQGYMTYW